jgi:hypothetical protein
MIFIYIFIINNRIIIEIFIKIKNYFKYILNKRFKSLKYNIK